jgi:hypothetical protein
VPPTERLPTHIIGRLKLADLKNFLSKRKFLITTTKPYKRLKGKRSILTDLSR